MAVRSEEPTGENPDESLEFNLKNLYSNLDSDVDFSLIAFKTALEIDAVSTLFLAQHSTSFQTTAPLVSNKDEILGIKSYSYKKYMLLGFTSHAFKICSV